MTGATGIAVEGAPGRASVAHANGYAKGRLDGLMEEIAERAKTPPANFEAEQGLLGAALSNNAVHDRCAGLVAAEDFADPVHGQIWAAIGRIVGQGKTANPVTLKTYFDQHGGLAEVGGAQYLVRLAAAVVFSTSAPDYARAVRGTARRRQLMGVALDLLRDASTATVDEDATALIARTDEALFRVAHAGEEEAGGLVPIGEGVKSYVERAASNFRADGKITGVPTGLAELDEALGGLHAEDLTVAAGRPGMGKTALATTIVLSAATPHGDWKGTDVAVFSHEMGADQIAGRLLAQRTGISTDRVRRGRIGQLDIEALVMDGGRLAELPIWCDPRPGLSVAQIASSLRWRQRFLAARGRRIGLGAIDYLQLMREPAPDGRRQANRVQEISDITGGLKQLAKTMGVPILLLSQLSREVERREDKQPQLSDLRDSGSIEQDADPALPRALLPRTIGTEAPAGRRRGTGEPPPRPMGRGAGEIARPRRADRGQEPARADQDRGGALRRRADLLPRPCRGRRSAGTGAAATVAGARRHERIGSAERGLTWRASGRSSRSSGPANKSSNARATPACCSSECGISPTTAG